MKCMFPVWIKTIWVGQMENNVITFYEHYLLTYFIWTLLTLYEHYLLRYFIWTLFTYFIWTLLTYFIWTLLTYFIWKLLTLYEHYLLLYMNIILTLYEHYLLTLYEHYTYFIWTLLTYFIWTLLTYFLMIVPPKLIDLELVKIERDENVVISLEMMSALWKQVLYFAGIHETIKTLNPLPSHLSIIIRRARSRAHSSVSMFGFRRSENPPLPSTGRVMSSPPILRWTSMSFSDLFIPSPLFSTFDE